MQRALVRFGQQMADTVATARQMAKGPDLNGLLDHGVVAELRALLIFGFRASVRPRKSSGQRAIFRYRATVRFFAPGPGRISTLRPRGSRAPPTGPLWGQLVTSHFSAKNSTIQDMNLWRSDS